MSEQPGAAAADAAAESRGLPLIVVLIVVAAYAAAVFLPFLGEGRLLTRHEVMQTQPALTILDDGQWVVPKLLGQPWIHKPPLAIWITAIFFAAYGGFSEFLARLPAALSAIVMCVLIALLTDRYYGRRAALLAGLAQATCVYMFIQGRLGEVDMPFAMFITAGHVVLAWCWGRGDFRLSLGAAALYHVMAGLAVLTKGPLGVILMGLPILALAGSEKSLKPIRSVLLTPAVILSIVIGFGWYVAVVLSLGDQAVERWNASYLQRFLGHYHLGSSGPHFYFHAVLWLTLPWTIGLFIGAKILWRDARRPDGVFDRYLWWWFLTGFAFLTIAAFRSPHYAVPILPPLSVLAGKLADEHIRRVGKLAKQFYVAGFAIILIVFLVIGGYAMPSRDPRKLTVAFVREELTRVPDGATLYVAGLAQSAVYPYIERDFEYINSFDEATAAVAGDEAAQPWVLTHRKYLVAAQSMGFVIREVAAEKPRRKVSVGDALVLGRLVAEPGTATSSAPASSATPGVSTTRSSGPD
jgi:4-amino-4-deoxy-L-arabinose transferase-like glycosyltransferase